MSGPTCNFCHCEGSAISPLRVLVVDDHHLFRTGIRALLEDEGFEVADAVSGEAGLRRLDRFAAHVVLMDVNLPGISGVEATRQIVAKSPGTAVLMLSITGQDDAVLEALRAGASGYLLKDTRLEDLIAGIRAAAQGDSAIGPRLVGTLVEEIRANGERRSPERAANHVSRALDKLGVDNRVQAATCAIRHGLADLGDGA